MNSLSPRTKVIIGLALGVILALAAAYGISPTPLPDALPTAAK